MGDLNAFPYVVFVYYCLKVWAFLWIFANKVASPSCSLYAEDNIKRFVLYNIFGDVLGLNSTGGPLGFRVKFFFATCTPPVSTAPLRHASRAFERCAPDWSAPPLRCHQGTTCSFRAPSRARSSQASLPSAPCSRASGS